MESARQTEIVDCVKIGPGMDTAMDDVLASVKDTLDSIKEQVIYELDGPPYVSDAEVAEYFTDELLNDIIVLYKMPAGIFVFDLEDIRRLRTEHRIIGGMLGALQNLPSQTEGSPLKLLPEQALVLVEVGVACISRTRWETVSPQSRLQANEEFNRRIHNISCIENHKRKVQVLNSKQLWKPKILGRDRQRYEQQDIPFKPVAFNEKDPLTIQLVDTPFKTIIPCSLDPPGTPIEQLRYQVFRELWMQGNFVGCGSNFAADFIVYKGDPATVHSYACVKCVLDSDTISALDIIRYCRVGTSVKKNIVLASLQREELLYLTLKWEA